MRSPMLAWTAADERAGREGPLIFLGDHRLCQAAILARAVGAWSVGWVERSETQHSAYARGCWVSRALDSTYLGFIPNQTGMSFARYASAMASGGRGNGL